MTFLVYLSCALRVSKGLCPRRTAQESLSFLCPNPWALLSSVYYSNSFLHIPFPLFGFPGFPLKVGGRYIMHRWFCFLFWFILFVVLGFFSPLSLQMIFL
jgi:hypothetical protein